MIACPQRDSPLAGQITGIRMMVRGDLIFRIEPKESIVKRMPSPDWADSLMLSMAAPNEAAPLRVDRLWSGGERVSSRGWL